MTKERILTYLRIKRNYLQYIFRNRSYDVYCPHCTSCGETGCCKPTICINHPKGFYCERNMGEMRTTYYIFNEFYNWLSKNKDSDTTATRILEELNSIYDKNMDELDDYLYRPLPEPTSFWSKLMSKFKK